MQICNITLLSITIGNTNEISTLNSQIIDIHNTLVDTIQHNGDYNKRLCLVLFQY